MNYPKIEAKEYKGDDGNIYQGANFDAESILVAKANGTVESLGFGEAGQVLKSDGEGKLPVWKKETEYTVESSTDGLAVEKTIEEDNDVICQCFNVREQELRELVREKGVFAGISAGANLYVAKQLAKEYPNKLIVAIIPDDGNRYLSIY